MHPELLQEVQGGLVDGHDVAQLLRQLGGRAPALPALRLERGALQQGREADVQGLGARGKHKLPSARALGAHEPPAWARSASCRTGPSCPGPRGTQEQLGERSRGQQERHRAPAKGPLETPHSSWEELRPSCFIGQKGGEGPAAGPLRDHTPCARAPPPADLSQAQQPGGQGNGPGGRPGRTAGTHTHLGGDRAASAAPQKQGEGTTSEGSPRCHHTSR